MISCKHANSWLVCELRTGNVFECLCVLLEDEKCKEMKTYYRSKEEENKIDEFIKTFNLEESMTKTYCLLKKYFDNDITVFLEYNDCAGEGFRNIDILIRNDDTSFHEFFFDNYKKMLSKWVEIIDGRALKLLTLAIK